MLRTLILLISLSPQLVHSQWKDNTELCEPVREKRWSDTGPIIGRFLDSLDYSKESGGKQGRRRRLKNVVKWLKAQPCVKDAKIEPGTLEQRIPIKEIFVLFVLNGHHNPMMIRIGLSRPYTFAGIYQEKN